MNALQFAIGGAVLVGIVTPMSMFQDSTRHSSIWVWIASCFFGGLCGAFFVLAMDLVSPDRSNRTLSTREHSFVKLLMVPTFIGAALLFVGMGTMATARINVVSPWPIQLILTGVLILVFPILIGGIMSLIIQLRPHPRVAEPPPAPKGAS